MLEDAAQVAMMTVKRSESFEGAFNAAFEHSMDGVLIATSEGDILTANPAACLILGASEEELQRRGRKGFTDPDEPSWTAALEERSNTGHVRAVLPLRRADGTPFFAEATSSAFVGPRGEPRICVIFRDVTDRVRLEQYLRARNEITQALLANKDTGDVLQLIASHARTLVDATHAAIFRATSGTGKVMIAAAEGPGLSEILGRSYPPGTLAAQVLDSGRNLLVEDLSAMSVSEDAQRLGLGPAIIVPIASDKHAFGTLMVARPETLIRPFGPPDLDVVTNFAEAAGVALALGESRAEVERLAVTAEQHRIAAEMHDSVIQQLFAVGLHLQQLKMQSPPPISSKVEESVHDVDEIINDIRRTIYDVRNAPIDGKVGESIRKMAADAGGLLGFAPHVTVSDSESIDPGTVGTQLLLVLREALSNVARHARASRVDVVVSVENGQVLLCVTDDGIGPPQGGTGGWGLKNMAQRAANLGGSFRLEPARPRGTRLTWSAPLHPVS